MLAHALAAALALVSAGAAAKGASGRKHATRPAPVDAAPAEVTQGDLRAENATRARRGLLPRKAKKKRIGEKKRLVWRANAPTWLGEPGAVDDLAPVAATGVVGLEEIAEDGVVRATFEGASVEILLVRRRTEGEGGPLIDATVEGAMVEAVLLRRSDSGP